MPTRLLLVSLHAQSSPEALGLGAASVAASVRAASREGRLSPGLEVSCLEAFLAEPLAALASRILAATPSWVGLSTYSWSAQALAALSRELKARAPGLLVFAGGPLASADPEGLSSAASLDFILRGEGEEVILKILDALQVRGGASPDALGAIAGVWLPGRSGRTAPLARLGDLPSPWLEGCIGPREGGVLWELARGCPFRCTYCYEGKGQKGIRRFSRARIEAELEAFVEAGVSQVFVLDPTFDADKEGARSLLALIEARAPRLHWKFEVRAELLDRDLARRFARLDLSLQIGLQTASPEVSAAVGRPLDLKAFTRGIGHLNEAGVVFGLDLIYGLPKDDFQGFCASVDFALGLQPNHLDLFPLSVLPGTELADQAAELGLLAEAQAPYALLSTPSFGPEDLGRASLLAAACDLFYSRGRAVAWFLQALRPLKARPSTFLRRFGDQALAQGLLVRDGRGFVPGPGTDSVGIEAAQRAFLEAAYREKAKEALLPALQDVLAFNAAWGRALAEGRASDLSLHYDPEAVLGPGALDLGSFVRTQKPSPGRWRVEPSARGPRLAKGPRRSGP